MNIMKFRKAAAVLGVLAILGTAGAAFANPAYHASSAPNQEQMAKMQELGAAHRAAVAPLMQQVQAKRAERDAQMYAATPDAAKIEALSKDIGALEGQIYAARASFNAQLAKEGVSGGWGGWCGDRAMAQGYGRGGHGGGHGGGYGGHGGGRGGCGGGNW